MSDIWVVGIPILLVDVISPVLLAATAFALTGSRPIANSCALILGHTIAYFVMGVLIVYGLAELLAPVVNFVVDGFVNPTRINFIIGFFLGVVLLGLAFKVSTSAEMGKQAARSEANQQKEGMLPSFAMGATLCVVGMPFAVPYFGFINEMFRFDVSSKPLGLLIYNLLYALPYALIPLAYALMGKSIVDRLKALNQFLSTAAAWLVPLLFGILGLGFIVDAIKYFATGSGLV